MYLQLTWQGYAMLSYVLRKGEIAGQAYFSQRSEIDELDVRPVQNSIKSEKAFLFFRARKQTKRNWERREFFFVLQLLTRLVFRQLSYS